MSPSKLQEQQWTKLLAFLRSCADVYVGTEAECRRFLEAVLWMDRTGAQWRELPERYGKWNSVYKRFARWCEKGIWERMLTHFASDADMEHLILDSSIVRAHPCAAEASEKRGRKPRRRLDGVEAASAANSI